jgi:hypothetical protein
VGGSRRGILEHIPHEPAQHAITRGLFEDAPPGVAHLGVDGNVGLQDANRPSDGQRIHLCRIGPDQYVMQGRHPSVIPASNCHIKEAHCGPSLVPIPSTHAVDPAKASRRLLEMQLATASNLREAGSNVKPLNIQRPAWKSRSCYSTVRGTALQKNLMPITLKLIILHRAAQVKATMDWLAAH